MNADESQLANEQDAETPVVTYDVNDSESITTAVTAAVSSASGRSATELRPLYSAVDPDALDSIFAPQSDGTPRISGGTVTFEYGPHRVRVESDRTVLVF